MCLDLILIMVVELNFDVAPSQEFFGKVTQKAPKLCLTHFFPAASGGDTYTYSYSYYYSGSYHTCCETGERVKSCLFWALM